MDRKEIDQKLEDISARMTSSKVFNSEEKDVVLSHMMLDQDELHFTVYVVDKEVPQKYKSLQERKEILLGLMK